MAGVEGASTASLPRARVAEVTLGEQIGKGSYGEVYRAKWKGRTVAAKRIHSIFFERDYDEEIRNHYVEEFRKEWVVLRKLDHPHIVKMYTVLFPDGCSPIIITELLSCDLECYISQSRTAPKVLRGDLINIALGISKGLHYLHSQKPPIVHRDLATKNILLTECKKAKIADLGVAKVFTADMFATAIPGTPFYSAPETYPAKQGMDYDDKAKYGVKADVFSFGVVLLAMIVGREPIVWPLSPVSKDGPSLIPEHKRRKKDLDEVNKTDPLRSLVFRCLDNAPRLRPTAAKVISELQGHESTLQEHVVELDCEDDVVFERIFSLKQKHFDYEFKLLFIGDFGVGKSCLMKRYRNPAFDIMMSTSTVGVDLDREIFRYGSNYVRAQIVDTGGQEQFFSVSPMYFRDVHGVFLVCDVTREHTFVSMRRWMDVAGRYCRDTVAVLAVGNKIDLVKERKVSYEKAKEFADTFQLPYIETSAKDVDSIQEMYHRLIQMLVKMVDLGDIKIKDSSKEEKVILAPAEPTRSKCICRKS